MSFFYLLAIALALAMDVLAVSLSIALSRTAVRAAQTLRAALTFGLFQCGMTILGAFAGENLLRFIERFDHWVAAGLLFVVGVRMGYESFRPPHEHKDDPTRGAALLVLAVATSLDALAVGLSLAALHVSVLYPAAMIGAVSFLMTVAGIKAGPRIGKLVGRWAELLGGLILLAIAARILVAHLRAG